MRTSKPWRFAAIFGLLFAVGLTLFAPAGKAQDAQTIAIIDVQLILREAKAVQALQGFVQGQRELVQASITQRESDLRAADQELAREKKSLSAEVYEERRKALADELAKLQADVQDARRQLDQITNQGMAEIQAALIPIVQQVATERDVDIVLSKALVVIVRSELEITQEVLRRLDETLPSVSVGTPAP